MRITRDAHGVPHVVAGSLLELARGQGMATAQDRAWQLEVERRRGEGTCAEIFGPAALEWDRLARRSLLADGARRAYAGLAAEDRAFLDAYAAGANEVLGEATVPELTPLRLQPGRWSGWTPIAVFAVQHLLFGNVGNKLWRHRLAGASARAGADGLVDLFRIEGLPGGSNAVAVGGSRTASGLPMVAGDPHRVLEAPGCYAQVRLTCTDPADSFEVVGLTFPGVPGVQHFGHTGDVAWGVTNAVADAEDLYVEELRREGDAVLCRGPHGWQPVGRRVSRIDVRRGDGTHDTVEVEVVVTDRGPVVLGDPDRAADGLDAGAAISLRTPPFVTGSWGFSAIPALLRARKTADVTAAFEQWVAPVNNLLVADRAGSVEHRVVGRVPVRDGVDQTGRLPRGADGHRWTGWVEDLPVRHGELLVSANDRVDDAWARIGDDFAPAWRRDRITALLEGAGSLTPTQLAAVLADVRQTAGAGLLDQLPDAAAGASDGAQALAADLLAWDRAMRAGSTSAARFAALRSAVTDLLHDALGLAAADGSPHGDLFAPWFDLRGRIRTALPALLERPEVIGVEPAALVRDALERTAAAGDPPLAWGTAHVAVPLTPHQQFGWSAPPGAPDPVPVGGDEECVQATRALGGTGASVHGPVARYVWDLGGASRWVVPLGAHGDGRSPHHHDQQPAWAAGETIPLEEDL
ncbi:penicillin acylase family protein [Nocardioides sambongensis]|uniref:penicillin acylase family protein n=1 Tax=Nocardioides sambongensis TaxID=2589074 RepID=UPI00112B8D10|nr:penicillin acylase family protein [Nocardioides sambongensis]